jgi:hypothetical protein
MSIAGGNDSGFCFDHVTGVRAGRIGVAGHGSSLRHGYISPRSSSSWASLSMPPAAPHIDSMLVKAITGAFRWQKNA